MVLLLQPSFITDGEKQSLKEVEQNEERCKDYKLSVRDSRTLKPKISTTLLVFWLLSFPFGHNYSESSLETCTRARVPPPKWLSQQGHRARGTDGSFRRRQWSSWWSLSRRAAMLGFILTMPVLLLMPLWERKLLMCRKQWHYFLVFWLFRYDLYAIKHTGYKCSIWLFFDKYAHHRIQTTEHLHQARKASHVLSHSITPSRSNHVIWFHYHKLALLIVVIHKTRLMQYDLFCAWLLYLQ